MKTIVWSTKVKRNPLIAFLLTLLAPGLGQLYTFQTHRGVVLLLSIPFLVFSSIAFSSHTKSVSIIVLFSFICVGAIFLYALMQSVVLCANTKFFVYAKMGCKRAIFLLAIFYYVIMFFACVCFFNTFSFYVVMDNASYPNALQGEVFLIKNNVTSHRGNLVLHKSKLYRHIANGRANLTFSQGRIYYGNVLFALEKDSENENDNVFLEKNMDISYLVHLDVTDKNINKTDKFFTIDNGDFLAISDNRNVASSIVLKCEKCDVVDNLIFSPHFYRIFNLIK